MERAMEIARSYGYIKIPDDMIISTEEVKNFKSNQIVVICPGASEAAVFCGVGGFEMKTWKLNFAGKVAREDLLKHTVARIKSPEEFYAPFPARYRAPVGKKSAAAAKP